MNNDRNSGYVNRDYRLLHDAGDLCYFNIRVKESDLAIGVERKSYTDSLIPLCEKELMRIRGDIEDYISLHSEFRTSLVPIDIIPGAPAIVREMARAANLAGVGPMAAVAGAVAQFIGEKLKCYTRDVVVENGGDIYINSCTDRTIAVFAGTSKFSKRIGVRVRAEEKAAGICTSSGTVGPSLSFGQADAAVIKGRNAALADAAATRAGNLVKTKNDLMKAVDYVKTVPGIYGILVIKADNMAAWGDIEIIPVSRRTKHENSE